MWLKTLASLWLLLISLNVSAAVILQYHHISDDTPAATSTSPALFKQHLDYLRDHQFTVLPLTQVLKALRQGEPLPDKTVVITFDDSYRSIYETAFPLLQEYAFPFTVFINTAPIGTDAGHFLRWQEVKEMSEAGAIIANHTHNHPHLVRKLSGEDDEQWRQRIHEEILQAERNIEEHTGQKHKILAYPYGEYDAAVIAELKALGFLGIGQHSGAVGKGTDWYSVPRFPMGGSYGNMQDFPLKVGSLALPIKKVELSTARGQILQEATVRAGDKPVLTLALDNAALLDTIACYFRGEPTTADVKGHSIRVQSKTALAAGRSRYNCTARDEASGRYYWFSQPWLVKGEDGQWQHSD